MLFHSWLSILRAVRTHRGAIGKTAPMPRCRVKRSRPRVEALEDRTSPAVLTVNSTSDTANPTDAYLSLRQAIAIVNSPTLPSGLSSQVLGQISGTLHGDGADTIRFDVSGPITFAPGPFLELSLPSTTSTIRIDGGTAGVTIDANHENRILQVNSGVTAELDHLLLINGSGDEGGAIRNYGDLTISASALSGNGRNLAGNVATGRGGAIFNSGTLIINSSMLSGNFAINLGPGGGGIYNNGTLTIDGSTLTDNHTSNGRGGAIFNIGGMTVSGTTLSVNSAGNGGGIYNIGGMTVSGSSLSGNSADLDGGGIYNQITSSGTETSTVSDSTLSDNRVGNGNGGGIYNSGGLIVSDCILSGNASVFGNGGGIYNQRNPSAGIGSNSGTLTIGSSTLSGNSAGVLGGSGSGGGIANLGTLTVNGSTLSDNSSITGGGISTNAGTLLVSGSILSGNSALGGGGIWSRLSTVTISGTDLSHNSAADGGGLWCFDNRDSQASPITISNCTLFDNSASSRGGGIFNVGGVFPGQGPKLTISGGALTGNSSSDGGGIYNRSLGTVRIDSQAILSGNSALFGGGIYTAQGTMTISGATLSGNFTENFLGCSGGGIFITFFGTVRIDGLSTIVDNEAPIGPDIENGGNLTVVDSTIGSLAFVDNSFPVVTFFSGFPVLAQATANVIAQVPAPLHDVYEDVYDENGEFIGRIFLRQDPVPVTITLNLDDIAYGDLELSTQPNVTLVVNGEDGTTIVGNSPALVVTAGNVIVRNVAFTTATNSPTIVVTGGQLKLSNSVVQESTAYDNVAIKVTGGSLDLGTADSPGGNAININGDGQFVVSTGPSLVTSDGAVFQIDGVTIPFDEIADLLAQVAALNLNDGQKNDLTSKLQAAQQSLARANTAAALNQLSAFINQLNALVRSHRLGEIDADVLIDETESLLGIIA